MNANQDEHLLAATNCFGFPVRLTRGYCSIYAGFRVRLYGRAASAVVESKGAIVAGCSGTTTSATMLLLGP
eukprot:656990-Pyramimonas_sp.AAC.1